MSNPFEEKKISFTPFIIIGTILILAIIVLSVYTKGRDDKTPNNEATVTPPIENDISVTPSVNPDNPNPTIPVDNPSNPTITPPVGGNDDIVNADDLIISSTIQEHVEDVISGEDLEYFLATMEDDYAYMISSEAINRREGLYAGDHIAMVYANNNGRYSVRNTYDSKTNERHMQQVVCFGHTIDGITSLKWDETERVFYSTGELRIADVAKKIKDPETGEVYIDIYIQAFVSWDYREIFKDDDMFRIHKVVSNDDGSLLGYVFEQTTMQFVNDAEEEGMDE